MKAALYTGIRSIQIQDVEQQAPHPGYVTIDTRCAGICGSDLHNYFGHWNPSATLAAGHELCGIVSEVAEDITYIQPGDRVTAECFSHCGACDYCRTGLYNQCVNRKWFAQNAHGGFAEYTAAHASSVYKLPETMSFEEGALVEPLAVGHRAVAQSGATYRDRVAIIGGGTIGQLCLAAAKAIGVKETLITVKYDQQAQLAQDLGADHIVHISETDVKDHVKALTDNRGMDAVIKTVGTAQNFNDTLAIVRKRGAVVLVAGYHQPLEVDLRRIVWSEAVITGSNCYGYSGMHTDFQMAIDLIASGRVPITQLVTHRFPFADIAEAFRVAADKTSGSVKVHLVH